MRRSSRQTKVSSKVSITVIGDRCWSRLKIWQSSARYCGSWPCNALYTRTTSLKSMRCRTGNQCSFWRTGVICSSDVKTEFFSQAIIDLLKPFLPMIEMLLLFETKDERRTSQAYAESHVGITWWTTLHNYAERPIADTKTCVSRYLTVITVDCTIFYRFIFFIAR